MSWTIYKFNVLKSMITFEYSKDSDGMADFISNQYDQCIKRGGDMIYGVPVINGNVTGMSKVIKAAFKKGRISGDENFNLLDEIYPAAFDAYWMGAEMAPIPNPLLKPLGWPSTPPAPGTIQNLGPNPISLSLSAATHTIIKEALQTLLDNFKNVTIDVDKVGILNVYDTVIKIINKKITNPDILNHPIIKKAKELFEKLKEAKKKKPAIGTQIKKALKFPFPKLPKRKEIIKAAKDKLLDEATKIIEETIIKPIEETILTPIYAIIQTAVDTSKDIPKKPTKEEIKKYVKDTIDGIVPDLDLSMLKLPKIPKRDELKKMIKEMTPTKEELKNMAYDLIKDKIPKIPNVHFVMPTLKFSYPTNILLEPFINVAKFHLSGVSGTMMVIAQYPPPAPPAPAIINWTGYRVVG